MRLTDAEIDILLGYNEHVARNVPPTEKRLRERKDARIIERAILLKVAEHFQVYANLNKERNKESFDTGRMWCGNAYAAAAGECRAAAQEGTDGL